MMQGAESEVQHSVRRLIGLFGQVLVELGNLMGAHAQAALPAGASTPEVPRAASVPEVPRVASAPEVPRVASVPEVPRVASVPAAGSGAQPEDVRERIERAVDAGLSMLVREERVAQADARQGSFLSEQGDRRADPPARPVPPTPPPPAARILRPAWMRASAPPFPGEDAGRASEPEPSEGNGAPDAAAGGRDAPPSGARMPESPAEATPEPLPEAWTRSPQAFQAGDLFLVCSGQAGRNLAIPWNWVIDTHLSARGTPEAFTLSTGGDERQVTVSTVVGIWTKAELERWQEEVRWLSSLEALRPVAPDERAPQPLPPEALAGSSLPAAFAGPEPGGATAGAAQAPPMPPLPAGAAEAGPASGSIPTPTRVLWVVSPSALARRFLLRHLEHSGLEIREARDLDDPLLPADLGSAGALFLDECLLEQWRDHPTGRSGGPPLVLLTVDGVLRVPPAGERPSSGAVLPRPFERSEVESVIGWLRSLWHPDRSGGDEDHGDEEDDTWLFADPFGSAGP